MEIIKTIESNNSFLITLATEGKPSHALLKKLKDSGLSVPSICLDEPVSAFYVSKTGYISLIFSFDAPKHNVRSFDEQQFCQVDDNSLRQAYTQILAKQSLVNSIPDKLDTVKSGLRLLSYNELAQLSKSLDAYTR